MASQGDSFNMLVQLHARRKEVVQLHRNGTDIMQIVQLTQLSYRTVRQAINLYETGQWNDIGPCVEDAD